MKTKREVLEEIVKNKTCANIECNECPYNSIRCHNRFFEIGAMAILRQNRKKRGFDPNKVLTCVTVDQTKIGTKGFFADDLATLREEFAQKNIQTLTRILNEGCYSRFGANYKADWALFYPIDEELAE